MAKVSSSEKVLYQFPTKIRVLAVDNDPTAIEFIKNTCNQCKYEVSICTESFLGLNLVRERKDCFDVILIEVHMPTMNGYEFLQHVSKEIDVPVIVMSLDHSQNTVMKAFQLGACDFWIKPLHDHQLKNLWTHVVRKSMKENKIQKDFVGSLEDDERKQGNENFEFGSSSVVRDQSNNSSRANQEAVPKKPRLKWSPELHSNFLSAVNNLGPQAVPKRILEVMNVPGLTKEHVASHLQKYRDFVKRKPGVTMTQTQGHTEMQLPPCVYGAQPPSAAIQRNSMIVGAMQQSLIHQQQIMISGNPVSGNPNPLRFVSQHIQISSTSVAVRSFPLSPSLSLNQEPPNTSASGPNNQNEDH